MLPMTTRRRRAQRKKPPMVPGFEGRMELVEGTVESPYRKGTFDKVTRNTRESSLAHMHARGQIDEAQLRAGEWFRSQYERMRMGSMAIDPSREPVDHSGRSDPIPDRMVDAGKALAAAKVELGRVGWVIVEMVCGTGLTVSEAARRVNGGIASSLTEKYFGRLLRDNLDVLAVWKGFATQKGVRV